MAFSAAILLSSCGTLLSPPADHNPAPPSETDTNPAPNQKAVATPLESATEDMISPVHPLTPTVIPGTGVFVNPGTQRPVTEVTPGPQGAISFNFVNADVRDVLHEILGEQLHLAYTIDSKVQVTITAQTGAPLQPDAVLTVLGDILKTNGLGLVETNGIYRVEPIADATKSSLGAPASRAGYGIRILPLRFVAASELKAVIEPFLSADTIVQVDTERNLLIVTGTDLDALAELVQQFDVDWLRGMSFALYPLQVGLAKDVAADLAPVFGGGGTSPLARMVRIIPLERLNAILVISTQRSYLQEVKPWIDRFDYGSDEMTPRIFEYHVQNSRAADLATVLTKLLSSGAVSAIEPTTAPGTQTTSLLGSPSSGAVSGFGGLGGGVVPGSQTPATTSSQPNQGPSAQPSGQPSPLENALAPSGVGGAAQSNLTTPPVRIVADEKNNTLVTYARPHDYRMILDIIKRLDVVPLQVMIEATVAEVTLNENLNYGLQFYIQKGVNGFSQVIPPGGTTVSPTNGIGAVADVAAVYPGFNYILANASERVILSMLSSITHVNVVSSPQLLVLDHQTASILVGSQVPIITGQAQSTLVSGAPIVNSVTYQNVGVILKVTPRVNTSGLVMLDIDQEVSDVAAISSSTVDSPTFDDREIKTSVIVHDNQTVALGGLIQNQVSKTKAGIPGLMDIPYLGTLFSSTTNTKMRTELIVLITPRIIRSGGDAAAMTNELRDRMQDVSPLVHAH
jgi:general secretion pathway protein D